MPPISGKAKQWIDNGKDPRSAHWQAGLEAMLDVFLPYLTPGKLVPVQSLEDDDLAVFDAIRETADLSPGLTAAFLSPSIAAKITPPDSAGELNRIEKGKPSYKILILRPGKEPRVMCAEVSPHATKPGADIFQSGALLGSYEYHTYEECIPGLTQTIRAHMWQKGTWGLDEHRRYTVNWFEKVIDLHTGNVRVEDSYSFLHSPTLIKGNSVDAIFTLIFDIIENRWDEPDSWLKEAVSNIKKEKDRQHRDMRLTELVERNILEYLNLMQSFEIIKFTDFSDRENEQFKNEFSRTMNRILAKFNLN
jgi:hypothetical protein